MHDALDPAELGRLRRGLQRVNQPLERGKSGSFSFAQHLVSAPLTLR